MPKDSKKQKKAAARGYATTLGKTTNLSASSVRAGKGKGTAVQRRKQNRGIAHGTVRLGRGGKSYNVYDAKTATWKKGVVKVAPTKPKSGGEPPNRSQKAAANKTQSNQMRMGYQYGTKYGKPANPYSNRGASVTLTPGGQPKAIRPSGSPVPGSPRNNPRSKTKKKDSFLDKIRWGARSARDPNYGPM